MAVIEFLAAAGAEGVQHYYGGQTSDTRLVGNDWYGNALVNRVVRYTITPPAEGAARVSLFFNVTKDMAAGSVNPLRFYIGTDPNSHINAWDTSEYTGELTRSADGWSFTAEFSMLMIPGTTYYLFVFPASKTYGLYNWYRYGISVGLTMELSGGAGLAYIDGVAYQCYIDNGSGWDLCMPYIDNGSSWDLYS